MGFTEDTGFCHDHGRVMVRAKTPNHVLHFLITFFTIGLWVVVWVIVSFSAKEWRCTQCGKLAKTGRAANKAEQITREKEHIAVKARECMKCGESFSSGFDKCPSCGAVSFRHIG